MRRLPRNVWVLSAASFLTDVSSEMLFNLLPLFLANVLGASTAVVGLIEGIAETTASLLKAYSGALSDRLGRRKTLTVLGYTLSTVAKPFLYLANSWGLVLGVRFTDRVGKGIRTAPRDALLAGSIEPERRGLAFGLHRAADTAGAFLGIGIAALIIWRTQASDPTLERGTFQTVVLASIIPAVLAVLLLVLGVREKALPRQPGSPFRLSLAGLDRSFLIFLGIVVIFSLGNSSDAFIILRAQERGLTVLQVMGMLLTFNAVYTLLSTPAGSISDRIGRKRVLLAGWLIYTLVYLGLARAQAGAQVWLLFSLYGFYYALTEGTARAMVADLVPEVQRGTAYGVYHAGIGLAALPASLIAGFLWQGIGTWPGLGPAAPFYFGAAMAMIAVGLLAFATPHTADRSPNSTLP
jgi:MFS family permease